jgi:hypothetical protein
VVHIGVGHPEAVCTSAATLPSIDAVGLHVAK